MTKFNLGACVLLLTLVGCAAQQPPRSGSQATPVMFRTNPPAASPLLATCGAQTRQDPRVVVTESPGSRSRVDVLPQLRVGDELYYQRVNRPRDTNRAVVANLCYRVTAVNADGSYDIESGSSRMQFARNGNYIRLAFGSGQTFAFSPERDVTPAYPVVVGEPRALRPFSYYGSSRFVSMTPRLQSVTAQQLCLDADCYDTVRVRVTLTEPDGREGVETTWLVDGRAVVYRQFRSDSELSNEYDFILRRHCRDEVCTPARPLS